MSPIPYIKVLENTNNIFWIMEPGFPNPVFSDASFPENDFEIEKVTSFFKAFHLLKELLDSGNSELPQAIIVDYNYLKTDNFRFLNIIKKLPKLRAIPFIVYADENIQIDSAFALRIGIDDYLELPVDWPKLKERIEFLQKFKPKLAKVQQPEVGEIFEYKIPFAKRILDIVMAGGALLVLSPILLLIALAIRLESKGGVIYRSKRVGTGYHVFDFLKFRSMYEDADKRLKELEHLNQYKNEDDNVFVKYSNDPRITKVGRLIRNTSLDEFPQLINVLKGDMSIVGNRPLPLYEAQMMTKDEWATRFLAPAGLTGLWQVTKRGKNDMSTKERVGLDIEYAKNYSFWYDIKIILKTFPAMIQHENV